MRGRLHQVRPRNTNDVFDFVHPEGRALTDGSLGAVCGDLLHTSAIDPGLLFEDARRPRNLSSRLVGALGHGAVASPLRAATHRTDSGCERALT